MSRLGAAAPHLRSVACHRVGPEGHRPCRTGAEPAKATPRLLAGTEQEEPLEQERAGPVGRVQLEQPKMEPVTRTLEEPGPGAWLGNSKQESFGSLKRELGGRHGRCCNVISDGRVSFVVTVTLPKRGPLVNVCSRAPCLGSSDKSELAFTKCSSESWPS